jgi:hypothetical protein
MMKHTALAAILSLGLVMPAAAAQATSGPGHHGLRPLQRFARMARLRVRLGVRTGRITKEELARLRTDASAVRGQIQALRQAGTPPTQEQRTAIRQALRQLSREIARANRGKLE